MIRISTCIVILSVAASAQNATQQRGPSIEKKTPPSATTQPKQRARVATNVKAFELTPAEKVVRSGGVVGASRAPERPVAAIALAPKLTRLYGAAPRFAWKTNTPGQDFDFSLTDEDGNEVFHDVARGMELQYPASAPKFRPGATYYWSVGTAGGTQDPSSLVGFVVLTEQERAEVDSALKECTGPDAGVARAHILRDEGLWYDALQAYAELIRSNPKDFRLYRERAAILAQVPTTSALADDDLKIADRAPK